MPVSWLGVREEDIVGWHQTGMDASNGSVSLGDERPSLKQLGVTVVIVAARRVTPPVQVGGPAPLLSSATLVTVTVKSMEWCQGSALRNDGGACRPCTAASRRSWSSSAWPSQTWARRRAAWKPWPRCTHTRRSRACQAWRPWRCRRSTPRAPLIQPPIQPAGARADPGGVAVCAAHCGLQVYLIAACCSCIRMQGCLPACMRGLNKPCSTALLPVGWDTFQGLSLTHLGLHDRPAHPLWSGGAASGAAAPPAAPRSGRRLGRRTAGSGAWRGWQAARRAPWSRSWSAPTLAWSSSWPRRSGARRAGSPRWRRCAPRWLPWQLAARRRRLGSATPCVNCKKLCASALLGTIWLPLPHTSLFAPACARFCSTVATSSGSGGKPGRRPRCRTRSSTAATRTRPRQWDDATDGPQAVRAVERARGPRATPWCCPTASAVRGWPAAPETGLCLGRRLSSWLWVRRPPHRGQKRAQAGRL